MRRRSWDPRALRDDPRVASVLESRPGQLGVALYEINLKDRALMLAGQAFIALVPLLIVIATVTTSDDGLQVGNWLINRFSLTGVAQAAVVSLFTSPPGTTAGLSVVSVVILLVSFNSFARLVQRTFELAWGLPAKGFSRAVNGMGATLVLISTVGVLAWTTALLAGLPWSPLWTVIIELTIAFLAWLLMTRWLLSGRVSWRLLVPGAVVGAVVQVASTMAGSIYVPYLVERNAERYGVIGVAIAMISWLVVLAFLLVAEAVTGAELGRWRRESEEQRAEEALLS